MRAAIIEGARSLVIEERPDPVPGPGEVLVRIRATGVCGSDVHGFEGLIPDRRRPGLIMGHESSGEVVEIGSAAVGWEVGDRVAIDPQIYCGQCYSCLRGWQHLCDNRLNLGSSMNSFHDGTLCELISLPPRQLHGIPEPVSFGEAAMVEPASCAVHIFNRAHLDVGSTVAVIGTGAIGLVAVQVAKLMGAGTLIAVDKDPDRLQLAAGFGADLVVDSTAEDPVERIMAESGGRGADAVVEAVGISLTYSWALQAVRKRGKLMALGYVDEGVSFPMRTLIFREIAVLGCTGFTNESDTVLDLVAKGALDVNSLITHDFPLEKVQAAFEAAADPSTQSIKVMVHP